MKYLRRIALWLVWNVKLGKYAPYIFSFGVGCKKFGKVSKEDDDG